MTADVRFLGGGGGGEGEVLTRDLLSGSCRGGGGDGEVVFFLGEEGPEPAAGRAAAGELLLLLQAPSLDLTLRSPGAAAAAPAAAEYQSVCTLEKVKSALERRRRCESTRDDELEGESRSSSSSSAVLQGGDQSAAASTGSASAAVSGDALAAAACPACLCYVLVSRSNPGCPRCHSPVPLPAPVPSSPAPPPASPKTLLFF
ncbi:unnamed protein product [Spirodela intermedia]|uniref:Uncharacterized protein n=1 Tax=Spirodela intermedia TaxID=51605 RepID=A0A7I8IM43_SPIIN|nr:unnamed protein product [Spirodela intermedia]CAA6658031.1 unnamed protein product [Spirodela intermedia]